MKEYDKYCTDEEYNDPYASRNVAQHGDYLRVQWEQHPAHIYKRVQPGEQVHPYTDQIEHDGANYRLEWIEDEQEFATSHAWE